MRVSNVDKHSRKGELPVRLCNYVDVYKNDRITPEMPFMVATATPTEIERFRLERGDVLITKDSEAWNDIGVPALVVKSADVREAAAQLPDEEEPINEDGVMTANTGNNACDVIQTEEELEIESEVTA